MKDNNENCWINAGPKQAFTSFYLRARSDLRKLHVFTQQDREFSI